MLLYILVRVQFGLVCPVHWDAPCRLQSFSSHAHRLFQKSLVSEAFFFLRTHPLEKQKF